MKTILSFLLLLAVAVAQAGVLMVQETTTGIGKKPIVSRISLGDAAVRMEMEGADSGTVIYRADKQLFWMIDAPRKSYMEMTKQDVEKMAGQMDTQMAQMQEQLKSLPAEQRAMVEKMMKEKGAAGAAAPAVATRQYVKKASGEKVGAWKADRFEWSSGARKETIWASPAAGLGIGAADMAVLKDMSKFFEKMARGRARGLSFDREDSGVKGVPVKVLILEGKDVSTSVLKELKKTTFPAGTFEIPAGYIQTKP